MKIAALYWPTSSVGGINTELRALRDAADARGDVFHVLRSGKHTNIRTGLFGERQLIRGGDTWITVDGEAPHGTAEIARTTAEWINANYDSVYLAFLCPHPTKDYGVTPAFLEMLSRIKKPITGRVTDGYWKDYEDWGNETIKLCKAVTVSQPAFASFFNHPRVKASRFPFSARSAEPIALPIANGDVRIVKPKREPELLTVWTSQWKAIKGIHKLLPYIPEIPGNVELYSNGILYYQLRTTEPWKAAVRHDFFGATTPSGAFGGHGKADFYGYIPLDDIPTVLSRAWFMIDLMGIGRPKNKVYVNGSFNNTTTEALYYGACPILHSQAKKAIPENLALFVDTADQVPGVIANPIYQKFAKSSARVAAAKRWVIENFDAAKIYDEAVLGRF